MRANERTDERVAQCLRLYSCLFQTTVQPPHAASPPSPTSFPVTPQPPPTLPSSPQHLNGVDGAEGGASAVASPYLHDGNACEKNSEFFFFVTVILFIIYYEFYLRSDENTAVFTATPVTGGWAGVVMSWAGAVISWAGAELII